MQISLPMSLVTHIDRRWTALTMLMTAATVLQLAAGTGLAYVPGFSSLRAVLGRQNSSGTSVVLSLTLARVAGRPAGLAVRMMHPAGVADPDRWRHRHALA